MAHTRRSIPAKRGIIEPAPTGFGSSAAVTFWAGHAHILYYDTLTQSESCPKDA